MNDRIQCSFCGKWYRVTHSSGMQWVYAAFDYSTEPPSEIDGDMCVRCIRKRWPEADWLKDLPN